MTILRLPVPRPPVTPHRVRQVADELEDLAKREVSNQDAQSAMIDHANRLRLLASQMEDDGWH